MEESFSKFNSWLRKYKKDIPKSEATYLKRTCFLRGPNGAINFPQLYLLLKIHKTPLATRPIVLVSGSPLHGLACWTDRQLQPIACSTDSYIQSSFDLVKKLQVLQADKPLPATALLFTCDAMSMYTNIDTGKALEKLSPMVPIHVLDALVLIMKHNVFQFSDTYWHQCHGTAMGTPPACMWATLFFASHEQHLKERYHMYLLHWSRYIDDGFGIWNWTGTPECLEAFNDFKCEINKTSLTWEVNSPQKQVHYLDLTLTITAGKIDSTLYEKSLSLYLYLPPGSAHPPGILKGLIAGSILQIVQLTSNPDTRKKHLSQMFTCLLA